MTKSTSKTITIDGHKVAPGKRRDFEIPVGRLPSDTTLSLPVAVVHGSRPGPRMWISAAIHGDEINGVEITRRVLEQIDPTKLAGTVIAVPIVNVFGFVAESRYLPDRRDLNRSFPGSARGSLAARLANLFMGSVVSTCSFGIDLHTGTGGRTNHPQIRADMNDEGTLELARAFGAPLLVHARLRDGSLREAAASKEVRVLVFEGGQAHRFEEPVIRAGVNGVLRVMQHTGMVKNRAKPPAQDPVIIRSTKWLRARRGGILRLYSEVGSQVATGDILGEIADAFGKRPVKVKAPADGWIIGMTVTPLVNPGDAIANIGVAG